MATKKSASAKGRKIGRNLRAPTHAAQSARTAANRTRRIKREERRQAQCLAKQFDTHRSPVRPVMPAQALYFEKQRNARQAADKLASIRTTKDRLASMFSLGLRAHVVGA